MQQARILIVEDEPIIAMDLENSVTALEYNCIGTVSSGDEALKEVAESLPDLVLMDIHLKGAKDGIETAREIHEKYHIPIIFVSAYSDSETARRAKVTEPYGYVLKPIRQRELQIVIDIALYKHQAEIRLKEAEQGRVKEQAALEVARHKSEFLMNLSHEMRTPLTGVMGMADLLELTPLEPEQKEYLRIIKDSGKHLLGLINDILDLSKVESGKLQLDSVEFGLAGIIESSIEALSVEAQRKNISLELARGPGVPDRVLGDPVRLKQVLFNLVGNAIKFTDQGKIIVDIELVSEKKSEKEMKKKLLFSVTDTGMGMSEALCGKLFQPFIQAEGSLGRKRGGTGLGLSISQKLVEGMGGKIHVESKEGKGSKFWFVLSLSVPLQHG